MNYKLVFISGKYRGKTEWEVRQNILEAEIYGAIITEGLIGKNLYPIIPHKNTAYFGGLRSDKYFLDGAIELLSRCDYIYMLPNWKESQGARKEYAYAKKHKIKILNE
jgi:hypothetical protein